MAYDTDPSSTTDSFEELMREAARGSEEAVWLLLERYSKNILRVVRRYLPSELRSKVDSTDIVQSVWKSLIRKGAKFDDASTPEKLVAYLAGMAKYKVYETHRHYTTTKAFDLGREQSLSQPGAGNAAAANSRPNVDLHDTRAQEPLEIISTRENWQRAINNSGDRGRRIVELRLQGLTYEEVAGRLNISVSTVRRALDSLLESLSS